MLPKPRCRAIGLRHLIEPLERRVMLTVAVPTLAAAGVTPSEIDLQWTGAVDSAASGLAIERSQGDAPFTEVAAPGLAPTSYADQKLPPLTSYRYRLREDFSDGTSVNSNVIMASSLPSSLVGTA